MTAVATNLLALLHCYGTLVSLYISCTAVAFPLQLIDALVYSSSLVGSYRRCQCVAQFPGHLNIYTMSMVNEQILIYS
jgi:hypothetical protein